MKKVSSTSRGPSIRLRVRNRFFFSEPNWNLTLAQILYTIILLPSTTKESPLPIVGSNHWFVLWFRSLIVS